ncbi:MAG: hypothetical protein II695_04250 [Oscillospiraceae bacterium]|nr:hypothetical protein [Oscillospiraceae bacterium]
MRKNGLALIVVALDELIMPVVLPLLGVMITGSETGLWIGLTIAPVMSFALSMLAVVLMYGKDNFPWLISRKRDKDTRCYDFEITEENAAAMSETVVRLFDEHGFARRTSLRPGYTGCFAARGCYKPRGRPYRTGHCCK